MFSKLIRGRRDVGRVEFCDTCGEVCSPACRAQARRDRTRDAALQAHGPARF